jgi:hypothetical protein
VRGFGALFIALGLAAPVGAQQLKLSLEHLESKSSNVVDVTLNGSTLQFAARFLDGKDPEEAKVKKMMAGIEGIYVKSFQFKQDGQWSASDLDNVRNQLRAPDWTRMIGFKSSEDKESAEVYVRYDAGKKVSGVAILVTSPREFTVVNIAGPIDLDSLGDFGGHFGMPRLDRQKKLE